MFVTRLERIFPDLSVKEYDTLRKWRVNNQKYYQTQVKITKKGFKKYLKEQVFEKERMMWWVVCRGKRIGHVGLYKRDWGWEADNILRGEGGFKGAMTEAVKRLLVVAKELGIGSLALRVLEWNTHAIEFYKKIGFKEGKTEDGFLQMTYDGQDTHTL